MGRTANLIRGWLAAALAIAVWVGMNGCGETPASGLPTSSAAEGDARSISAGAPTVAAVQFEPAPAAPAAATAAPEAEESAKIPEYFRAPKGGWPKEFKTKYTKDVAVEGITDPKDAHYDIWVPETYSPDKAAPLVIVLHGGPGGKAIALASVLAMGMGEMGAISVYPQALRNDVMLEWNYPHEGAFLIAIIKQVAQQYHIDPRRIYLMGHSMGGGGAWHNGSILHDIWAGIAPLSGWYGPTPHPPVSLLKDMPTYIIHGDKDMNVLVQRSQAAVAEFKRMNKTDYVYKELAGVGHQDYLDRKNANHKELLPMAKWLLEQKRAEPADLDAAEKSLAKWGGQFGWAADGGLLGHYREAGEQGAKGAEQPARPAPRAAAEKPLQEAARGY